MPQEVDPNLLARAKHLWVQFTPEQQDMPFSEFLKEIVAMADPKKMREDMMDIQLAKARIDSNRLRIDKALERNNGN